MAHARREEKGISDGTLLRSGRYTAGAPSEIQAAFGGFFAGFGNGRPTAKFAVVTG